MARVFKKLFSQPADLINKEYPSDNGTDFALNVDKTFESNEKTKAKVSFSKNPDNSLVTVVIEPSTSFEFKDNSFDFAAKLSTENKHEGTLTLNKLADGKAKVSVKEAFKGAMRDYNLEFAGEYVDSNVAFNASANFSGENMIETIKAKTALVYVVDDLAVGVEVNAIKSGDDMDLGAITIRAEEKTANYTAAFEAVFDELNSMRFGYYQKINNSLEGATDISLGNTKQGALTCTARVGFVNQIDSNASLRTRLSVNNENTNRVGFVYQRKYDNNFQLALGADLNTSQLLGGNVQAGDAHKFSVTLSLD